MLPALAFAACLLPPTVFACFPPHTPKWRAARKVYWVVLPVAAAWFAVNLFVLDPAGPAALYYGMWFGFVVVASVWAWAAATIRVEWSERRERQRAKAAAAARAPDPTKPWKK